MMDAGFPMVIMENSFIHWIVLHCRLGFSKHFDSYWSDNSYEYWTWINLLQLSAAWPLFTSMSEPSVVSPMQESWSQSARLPQASLLYQLWQRRSLHFPLSPSNKVSTMRIQWPSLSYLPDPSSVVQQLQTRGTYTLSVSLSCDM